jgi:hypothetical protein
MHLSSLPYVLHAEPISYFLIWSPEEYFVIGCMASWVLWQFIHSSAHNHLCQRYPSCFSDLSRCLQWLFVLQWGRRSTVNNHYYF